MSKPSASMCRARVRCTASGAMTGSAVVVMVSPNALVSVTWPGRPGAPQARAPLGWPILAQLTAGLALPGTPRFAAYNPARMPPQSAIDPAFLRSSDLFENQPDEVLQAVLVQGRLEEYGPG